MNTGAVGVRWGHLHKGARAAYLGLDHQLCEHSNTQARSVSFQGDAWANYGRQSRLTVARLGPAGELGRLDGDLGPREVAH